MLQLPGQLQEYVVLSPFVLEGGLILNLLQASEKIRDRISGPETRQEIKVVTTHGNGRIDSPDGRWTRNSCDSDPRAGCYNRIILRISFVFLDCDISLDAH